jgi:hypothetical protein
MVITYTVDEKKAQESVLITCHTFVYVNNMQYGQKLGDY